MNQSTRARAWLAQAENDLAHARHAVQGGFFAQACYAAQQAVEKALKGLLLHSGGEAGRTHSIIGLRKALKEGGIELPADVLSLDEAQDLTRMNIETRYPLGDAEDAPFELFGPEQAARAIAVADRVLPLCRHAIGS
ncbi:hypothetical protein B1C78_08295 [Thioalkalivibrio denitrificans]|uniref:HEPN domain-containing protein n=1 Tax=Thioalkalivibrio denitrificans TaxID=108003 RepID=A0A1V3NIB2_9GAMM|nr:HEPN domain-containing protein [Thioalkalivibrio denitrificans]OOG24811.1 hypothetical protein B1C78_08295 [Thioalkalivibrio denitrificans]